LRDGKPEVLIPAGTPIPFTARTFFVPPRTERAKLSLFQNAGDIQEEGLPGSRTILSMVNLDVVEGVEVEFCCALSASGLMNISARHGNTAVEIPFYLPPGDDKTPAPASPRRRIRELKLRLTPLEPLLPLGQADRLHNLIRRIEGLESEESAAEMLESLVKDLEIALS
jgi:hypothetical protein